MSHKNQHTQLWKAERMDETMSLWKQNDNLPPDQRLYVSTIAKKVGIGKTTTIERLLKVPWAQAAAAKRSNVEVVDEEDKAIEAEKRKKSKF